MNILLIEPDYRSKFPPLGLMRISMFHKSRGDQVVFTRGKDEAEKEKNWHRIYISTLFTYELPKTIDTIKFYSSSVDNPHKNIYVGGIAATLMPEYINKYSQCKVIVGCLDSPNILGFNENPVEETIPDYKIIDDSRFNFLPKDSYFGRITKGCIRNCEFCAVPKLEPKFYFLQDIKSQIELVNKLFSPRKNLVILDNNILALKNFATVVNQLIECGFYSGAMYNNKFRTLDFNQGIDARLISKEIAKQLSHLCVSPIRLAFDHMGVENQYREAIAKLVDVGFTEFTTYIMYNFKDSPENFYKRMAINLELSQKYNIRITGFPMKYSPINDVNRHYVGTYWNRKLLRGIQCVLNATHGLVSPNPEFFETAFGKNINEFLEIVAMPDDLIIYRKQNELIANEWRKEFNGLSPDEKTIFFEVYEVYKYFKVIKSDGSKFTNLLKYYFPKINDSEEIIQPNKN
jgi:hypothetical protein